MTTEEHLLVLLEDLHIPLVDASSPTDGKEWYHYVLFEPVRGIRLLANVALSGRPGKGMLTVTMLATLPRNDDALPNDQPVDTYAYSSSYEWEPGMVQRAPLRIAADGLACLIEGAHSQFEAQARASSMRMQFQGIAHATPILVPEMMPFSSGFVGWGFVPGLEVQGLLALGDDRFEIDPGWFCYHDHNYGRFRWGENIGWIWFIAATEAAAGASFSFVLHQGMYRDQRRYGTPHLFVYEGSKLRKVFLGPGLEIKWQWHTTAERIARLPGSMASLFSDRLLRMPRTLEVRAADERDHLALSLPVESMVELVLPDDQQRQYSFIEELNGPIVAEGRIGGQTLETTGLFYAEYVL